jgi:hypothetical protein
MVHEREEVIERTKREFEQLDQLIAELKGEDWERLVPRPESKEPWTVKDALVHITYWKADVVRSIKGQHRPLEERGLQVNDANHIIYMRWRDRSPMEVLTWHRQVQEDVLAALKAAPEEWYSHKERNAQWPYDLVGHSAYHRIRDIQRSLTSKAEK